eukprot:TRINITY_DN16178_c0_g1_i2.p1 TRINITY_DN16178_c0_g1~~TRINITY_DN16178_c0_g1_i2.p1  ORF type:complete len:217 (+),score=45.16 TRINITY_DN16178_c0_g1_i2:3-653(+)
MCVSLLCYMFFFLIIRLPPRSTLSSSSAASDVYKRQYQRRVRGLAAMSLQPHRFAGAEYGDLTARLLSNLPGAMMFGAARGQFDVAVAADKVHGGQRRLLFWANATTGSALYYSCMLGVHVAAKRAVETVSPPKDPTQRSPVLSAVAGSLTYSAFSVYAQMFSKTGVTGPLDPVLYFGNKAGPRGLATLSAPRTASAALAGAVVFGGLHLGGCLDL